MEREAVIEDENLDYNDDASQSDLVRICLNLAFIDKTKLRTKIKYEGLLREGLAKIKQGNVINKKMKSSKSSGYANSI